MSALLDSTEREYIRDRPFLFALIPSPYPRSSALDRVFPWPYPYFEWRCYVLGKAVDYLEDRTDGALVSGL